MTSPTGRAVRPQTSGGPGTAASSRSSYPGEPHQAPREPAPALGRPSPFPHATAVRRSLRDAQ
jgi:hypothetical protein